MDVGDAHAVGQIAVLIVAGVVAWRSRTHERPKQSVVLAAVLPAALVGFLVLALNAHLCFQGNPVMQCLLPSAVLAVVLRRVKGRLGRLALAVILVGAMTLMAFHYTDLVHTAHWTGNPRASRPLERVRRDLLVKVQNSLDALAAGEAGIWPEGWLRESRWAEKLQDVLDRPLPREVIGRAWHSPLTLLFPRTRVPQDYWYPGGGPADAGKVQLRDRP